MLKKLMQELDKGVQQLKESALSADPKAKAEELARAAGGGVAQAAQFLKERAEAVKPKAEALGQAAREGFERKAEPVVEQDFGDAGEFDLGASPARAEGEAVAPAAGGKAAGAARVAGEGVGAAFKFVKEALDAARPGVERAASVIAQGADDLARAAREGYEQRSREAELKELARQEREDLARRKDQAQTVEPIVAASESAKADLGETMASSAAPIPSASDLGLEKAPESIDRKNGSV